MTVDFPETGTLVLLGENNAGKSNITRALDILFGDMWPASRRLEEHDFHGRDSDGIAIRVGAHVSGVSCPYCGGEVSSFKWEHDQSSPAAGGDPVTYSFACGNDYCQRTFVKKEMRTALSAAVLDADRRLDYQLSYTSKFTMLSKLMHRFHERLMADPARKDQLAHLFLQLLEEFDGVPEFAKFREILSDTAADFGQNLPYRLDIDFSAYDPSNFFRSLRVHPTLADEVRNFDELGTGQSQVLALAFAYAYAMAYGQSDGTILVIDEPEANLHPLAQQWLATQLGTLTAPGLQVVITTHSPHFVDLARPENLVMVSKGGDGATRVVQRTRDELRDYLVEHGADAVRTQSDTIGGFYAASATTEIVSGLFSRRCVLVEGITEALALPELLRARGLDVLREGIAIVSAEGIGNIAKWHRLYTALGIECYCVFDTDSDKKGKDAADLTRKRRDIMSALGLSKDLGESDNLSTDPITVTSRYSTLAPNFEGAVECLFGERWASLHTEAVAVVGESKPLRARYAAQRLSPEEYPGEAAAVLDALVNAIRGDSSIAQGT
ncbi:AAA family ATPase [Rhodococcus ruber]|uniref:ATP-dependent nuclease n=1 Tax=Rhodococcus TaxID=1827 RepID=UPI00058EA363|nr:AAA family ATPase [Rhodococcus ruber]MCD2130036.1 AAA family ATPase [Rhodococcus ruber]MCZ4506512.1 AAA family ATPase [Rhodococcus ruber]MCZ4533725.1 AAA family ATPase [Rhodococcus ruber]MCZ4623963.1 AAA family ATPase [Rhodococcus ruber]MDI9985434.1 AAA family ATPase [Rhodococcus ruber]